MGERRQVVAVMGRAGAAGRRKLAARDGQMAVELAVVLPVVLVIAVSAVNACAFFSECARFDRIGRNAVRVVAASPAYEQDAGASADQVRAAIEEQMGAACSDYRVTAEQSDGYLRFTMTMSYEPTLFGMGLRQSIFGVDLPKLSHSAALAVDRYKPGMLF